MLAERDSCCQTLKEMSRLVRSLQNSSCFDEEENIWEEDKDLVLTPDRAIEMTLKHNKSCIESLDDNQHWLFQEPLLDKCHQKSKVPPMPMLSPSPRTILLFPQKPEANDVMDSGNVDASMN